MSARIASKRSRTEEEEEDVPPTKRGPARSHDSEPTLEFDSEDEEFWFEDGTVILVARDVEFRVYEGLLSGLSSVFKNMFAECHTVRSVRVGRVPDFPCPVVRVSDSPEDLRYLLRICFSRSLESLYDERDPSFDEISAAIRLGDKYKIAELYSQSLGYLKRYFPDTFDKWDALRDYTPPSWALYEELGVINLARLTGELSLLPAAFIACICAPSTEPEISGIGHGLVCPDGSEERLSPGDLTVCLEGKTRLRAATLTASLRTFKPTVSPQCMTASACKKALRDVLLNLEGNVDDLVSGDPLMRYESLVEPPDGPGLAICPSCATMVGERSLKEREDVWDRLPKLLGIDVPGWPGKEPEPEPWQEDAM